MICSRSQHYCLQTRLLQTMQHTKPRKLFGPRRTPRHWVMQQTTIMSVIWQKYETQGVAKDIYDALETAYGQAGGANMCLQMVNKVKIQFTDSMDLWSQIQQFQDNYNRITSNGHSRLSEDLATFMFCSSLPDSYESTAQQYLDNIMAIANYKLSDIIA